MAAIAFLLGFGSTSIAGEAAAYSINQLEVSGIGFLDDGAIQIIFTTDPEETHHCPGVNFLVTENGIELLFVRARKSDRVEVAIPAVKLKGGSLLVTVAAETKGVPVYARDRHRLVLLTENLER